MTVETVEEIVSVWNCKMYGSLDNANDVAHWHYIETKNLNCNFQHSKEIWQGFNTKTVFTSSGWVPQLVDRLGEAVSEWP